MKNEIKKQLEELVPSYACANASYNKYKKQNDSLGKDIKTIFAAEGIEEFSAGGYTATVKQTTKISFDETKLLAIIKKLKKGKDIIKKKEYVDEEALERAIYDGEIVAADLALAQVITHTPTLKLKGE